MCRNPVDDIAEMAFFARQDGHMDWQAHIVATQANGMEDGNEGYHAGGETVRRGVQACGTIDAVKYVVIGSWIFIPDFSERSEISRGSCLVC